MGIEGLTECGRLSKVILMFDKVAQGTGCKTNEESVRSTSMIKVLQLQKLVGCSKITAVIVSICDRLALSLRDICSHVGWIT
jgi:hypothetical protein